MKIFLIGMPGSGKSTIGKRLAEKLRMPFIDLDTEIEKREGKPVKDIFTENGEAYFRELESETLNDFALSGQTFVMATGGGAPCFHGGIDIINAHGISIFLDVPIEEIISRIENQKDRPLLLSTSKVELTEKLITTRNGRLTCYQQASVIVPNATAESVYEVIMLRTKTQM